MLGLRVFHPYQIHELPLKIRKKCTQKLKKLQKIYDIRLCFIYTIILPSVTPVFSLQILAIGVNFSTISGGGHYLQNEEKRNLVIFIVLFESHHIYSDLVITTLLNGQTIRHEQCDNEQYKMRRHCYKY